MEGIKGTSLKRLHTEDAGFGVFDFYESFVVGVWKDNHATADQVEHLRHLCDDYFQGRPYGYIGNRVNPHSVDVGRIRNVLEQAVNLKAVAFVIYSRVGENVAQLEKMMYKSHDLQICGSLEEAMHLIDSQMKVYRI